MNYEATNSLSLPAGAWMRECRSSDTPVESRVDVFSDRGSTPLASTTICLKSPHIEDFSAFIVHIVICFIIKLIKLVPLEVTLRRERCYCYVVTFNYYYGKIHFCTRCNYK